MRPVRKLCLSLVVFVAIALGGAAAHAARSAHGPIYPVSVFEIEYALDHPRHPPEADLLDIEVGLSSEGLSFVAPRPVDRTVRMRLSSLPPGASFSATAIQHITRSLVATLNRRGIQGVIVTVPGLDERTGADLRSPGDTVLRIRVWTGRISRVTTLADGDRFGGLTIGERTNHTAHQWIKERAPVQPGGLRGLLGVEALEEYAAQVSRQAGRRVDVEIEAGSTTGTTDVNLRVIENKPWLAYAQYSNTGTEATTRNRERFGFVHNQVLGRDDRLRLDYTTGDFDAVHAVRGSYAAPFLIHRPRWRWRAAGRYSQFDASEVGSLDSRYEGQQAYGEADVIWNAYQRGELFVDVEAGARVHQMAVRNAQFETNTELGDDADAIFLVPRAGISAERNTRTSSFLFGTHVDLGFTDEDETELRILGTPSADEEFVVLRWDGSLSLYLEPLLDRQAWEDPSTPESSTRAHEVAAAFRGQWAFDNRLVPQYQAVAGGMFTVRGYEQASVARDNLFLGSAEYRLHIPRLFDLDSEPPEVPGMGEFRARPQHVYGNPDWDLILRVFADAARVIASDATDLADETDETLVGLGGGLELQLLRNLNIRFDVGHALTGAGKTDAGDTRGHIMATLLY